ncbi:hypothetical protein KJ865_13485, partial [Myxococcota bacterium]|nr:hypothetical protein [Myxococcota bacterium]
SAPFFTSLSPIAPWDALSEGAARCSLGCTFATWDQPHVIVIPSTVPIVAVPEASRDISSADQWEVLLRGPVSLYHRGLSPLSVLSAHELGLLLEALKMVLTPGHAPAFAGTPMIEPWLPTAQGLCTGLDQNILRRTMLEIPVTTPEHVNELKRGVTLACDRISYLEGGSLIPFHIFHALCPASHDATGALHAFVISKELMDFLHTQPPA